MENAYRLFSYGPQVVQGPNNFQIGDEVGKIHGIVGCAIEGYDEHCGSCEFIMVVVPCNPGMVLDSS